MKTCSLLVAACGCVLAAQAAEIPSATLAADPRYAEESGRTGEPMMRLLEYAYPGHGYEEVSDQFLMGDRLMVAPQVAKDAATRKVHIPPGRWRADDGRVHEGPAVVEVATPLARLPHFEKLTD